MKSTSYLKFKNNCGSIDSFKIVYRDNLNLIRHSERYDFTDEWNNLGYGAITQISPFCISDWELKEGDFDKVLAEVVDQNNKVLCIFCGIVDSNGSATLVYNREIGSQDGVDHWIAENFLTNYKIGEYGSVPILSEIPYGFEGAVTMRIDCDEEISSGRDLFELYREKSVPFSMAIKTSLNLESEHKKLIDDVIEAGGSIVSHSHTHAPNWGGSREQAKWEAETARERLKTVLPPNYSYDWVVSPFHQNPQYAVQGLVDAGIKGFVGGIIKNDPEYLQARAGLVSTGEPIITHSQQCMLHGDCYHETGLEIYKQSFTNHLNTNTFFGFLDHPFSDYWYGWDSEEERLKAHGDFLDFTKSHDNIWYANLIDAMNFLWVKAHTKVWIEDIELKYNVPKHSFPNIPDMKVFWNGEVHRIPSKSQ